MKQIKSSISTIFFFLIVLVPMYVIAAQFADDKKGDVDQEQAQPIPKTSIKCGECPCGNPCNQPPPPPPKITASYCPPPSRFYYFSGPGDDQARVATPPPPRFTYITSGSPPGNLYPTTDPFNLEIYNGVDSNGSGAFFRLILLVLCSFLQTMIYYGAH